MKYLALDLGEKRIGVAKSDDSGIIAIPLGVVQVDGKTMENLGAIVKEEKPDKIIFGIPRHANGEESGFAKNVRDFAEGIKHEYNVKVDFEDEFGTTIEAADRMRKSGVSERDIRKSDDAFAAQVILESYLARTPNKH